MARGDGNGKVGKPTDYKPEYCEMLVEHMRKGYSWLTFCEVVGVCPKTLYLWCEKNPEFLSAKERGFEAAKKFFEEALIKKVSGTSPRGSDTGAITFALKTRFWQEYGDKMRIDQSLVSVNQHADIDKKDLDALSVEELHEKIRKKL